MSILIRSFLFYVYLVSITIIGALLGIVITPFTSVGQRYALARHWSWMNLWMLDRVCNIQCEVIGMQHVLECGSKPMILLSKHQSAWETLVYPYLFPRTLCFV